MVGITAQDKVADLTGTALTSAALTILNLKTFIVDRIVLKGGLSRIHFNTSHISIHGRQKNRWRPW